MDKPLITIYEELVSRELPENIFKRRGRFNISLRLLLRHPDMIQLIMERVIVTRAEVHFLDDVIRYDALSPLFPVLPEGAAIPVYEFEVVDIDGEHYEVAKPIDP